MANARFFKLLAVLVSVLSVGLSLYWLAGDWFPGGNDEITHLQNARNVATELLKDPLSGLPEAWMGRYPGEERPEYWPGAVYLSTLPLAWTRWLRAPLGALFPALILLLWAVGRGARRLSGQLARPETTGSVALAGRRLGVTSRQTRRLLRDATDSAAWRAILLALLPVLVLVEYRHYTPTPFVAAAAALATVLLVRSQGLTRPGAALGWGFVVALGLMADRLSMAFLVWAPLLVALTRRAHWRSRLLGLGLGLAPIVVLAGPFYLDWWQSWGRGMAGWASQRPAEGLARLAELGLWLPTHGFGLAAALLLGLGVLALLSSRPGFHPDLATWLAALVSPLPLLAMTESAQQGLVIYLVAPLAVLAGVGWGRGPVARSAAGLTFFSAGTALALLFHVVAAGLLPLDLPFFAPTLDRSPPSTAALDRKVLSRLEVSGSVAVLDLLQAKGAWAGHWLYYLVSVQAPHLDLDWPLRRNHAAYQPGRFVQQPCGFDSLLVIHQEDPWFASSEIARPLGFVGMDSLQEATFHEALGMARLCYGVDMVEQAPGGARLTWLKRKEYLPDHLLQVGGSSQPRHVLGRPVGPGAASSRPPDPAASAVSELGADAAAVCPLDMALIPGGDYDLSLPDQVSLSPYMAGQRRFTLAPFCMDRFEFPNERGAMPRTLLTWEEARQACQSGGKRLCTRDEWEAACRGKEGRRYSYGDTFQPERCYTRGATHFDVRDLRPAGSFSACSSPQGVHDLDGSVSEWVDEELSATPFPHDPEFDPARNLPCHSALGGTMWTASYGQDCLSRHWHATGHKQDDDGFRCCRSLPEQSQP